MSAVPLTNHGELRARKRLGLNRKAVGRSIDAAWAEGREIKHFTGSLKKYLGYEAKKEHSIIRVHKGNIYLFSAEGALKTCWPVPTKYRKVYQQQLQKGYNNGMDERTKNVTISKKDLVARHCKHCGTKTIQLGKDGNTCLQCIADGGGCCSIASYNRWQDVDGKPLTVARGKEL